MTNAHDDFELKRALDALPRAIEPPDDLWPGIRAALEPAVRQPPAATAPAPWRRPGLRIAALLTLLTVAGGALAVERRNAGRWEISSAGLGTRPFAAGDRFASGSDSARLRVGTIGEVGVTAGTDVRLIASRWSEHRLALARGTIHARIDAPPRLFIVETPSGTAVDLGCAYTLAVDSAGASRLVVTAGWVEFSGGGRTSLIPAGFSAAARRGAVIGTPLADDAPAVLVAAVGILDLLSLADDAALTAALDAARRRDAVTLWHLLQRTDGAHRRRVLDRLVQLVPPPDGVVPAALPGNARMMRLYWTALPGTLPIIPEWQAALWRLWLRVAG